MIHKIITDGLLTCCRTDEELQQLRCELENSNHAASWHIQSNLSREKTGFRCNTCGSFYPALEIFHKGKSIDPKAISKPPGRLLKLKKFCNVFLSDHYYATNKKTLLRFDIDAEGNACQSDEFPIMGGVFYVAVSADERFIATQNNNGTIAVIDAETKQTIAKKRSKNLIGRFRFTPDNKFLYYLDDAIRCWDFLENQESILWQVPESWKGRDKHGELRHVFCSDMLCLDRERTLFRLGGTVQDRAVILHGLTPIREVLLPEGCQHFTMTYQPRLDQYTLASEGQVLVCDGEFRQIDTIPIPRIQTRLDGGGMFPIKEFRAKPLSHAHLSPDGKWVLFDFHTYLLLMDREIGELCYCVYSYTGTASTKSGFVDNNHAWYNWADSTCIMELPAR